MDKNIYIEYYQDILGTNPDQTIDREKRLEEFTEKYIAEVLKDSSYFLYEFEDITVTTNDYKKEISPLFSSAVINSKANQNFLEVIFEEVPYYYKECTVERTENEPIILATRDSGINNVPSPLQTPFWNVWFQDAWGSINNDLLLDIFNKLRFPYMGENQFLNANFFVEFAEKAFFESGEEGSNEEGTSLISFKNETEEDVEYLNDIIEKKLTSMYQMLDYKPDLTDLLTAWSESLFKSGQIDESEVLNEKTLYKLQDLKYELLRRKFAGSSTLYKLALSSIARQGSFVGKVEIGKLTSSISSGIFRDPRFVRTLNIPGILSQFADFSDIDPIGSYYKKPLAEQKTYIELDTLAPLFYTSAPIPSGNTVLDGADPEVFYNMDEDTLYYDPDNPEKNNIINTIRRTQSQFLRDNIHYLNWDAPSSIISSRSINTYFPRLDDTVYSAEEGSTVYRTLDSDYELVDSITLVTKVEPYRLDLEIPYLSTALISGNVLDMNANHILYHSNVLQKESPSNYPFVTYRIADNNSLSLSDPLWIDYLKASTERKSRIADDVSFGVQVSTYKKVWKTQLVDYYYFGISYSNNIDEVVQDSFTYLQADWESFGINAASAKLGSTDPTNKKVTNLWFIKLSYTKYTFKVFSITGKLMTRVVHKINADDIAYEEFKATDLWKELTQYSLGLLPFTYKDITEAGLKLGLTVSDEKRSFIDDIKDRDLAKAIFVFSKNDLLSIAPPQVWTDDGYSTDPRKIIGSTSTLYGNCLSWEPDIKTKGFFYIVKREREDKPFTWSEFIKTQPIDINIILNNIVDWNTIKENPSQYVDPEDNVGLDPQYIKSFYPDWYNLDFYINPYLNFTEESASPLRATLTYLRKGYLQKYPIGYPGTSSGSDRHRFSSIIPAYDFVNAREYRPTEIGQLGNRVALSNLAITHNNFRNIGPRALYYYRMQDSNSNFYATDDSSSLIIDGFQLTATKDLYEKITLLEPTDASDPDTVLLATDPVQVKNLKLGDNVSTYYVRYTEKNTLNEDIVVYELTKDSTYQYGTDIERGYYQINFADEQTSGNNKFYKIISSRKISSGSIICSNYTYYEDPECTIEYKKPQVNYFMDNDLIINHVQSNVETIDSVNNRPYSTLLGDTGINKYKNYFNRDYGQIYYDNLIPCISMIPETDNRTATYLDYLKISCKNEEAIWNFNLSNFTLCLNITFNKKPTAGNYFDIIDGKISNDFSLKYGNDQFILKIKGTELSITKEVSCNSKEEKVPNSTSEESHIDYTYGENYRIAISVYKNKIYFRVNETIRTQEVLIDSNERLPIFTLLSSFDGKNNFFDGSIYDFRIYCYGVDDNMLQFLEMGTMNELYSYAPAAYKLGNSIYDDLAVLKNTYYLTDSQRTEEKIAEVTTIRIFNRSVWDSIIVDMYAATDDEATPSRKKYDVNFNNPNLDYSVLIQDIEYTEIDGTLFQNIDYDLACVEQKLSAPIEVANGQSPISQTCTVRYNNKDIDIRPFETVSLITTSLYPVYYQNQLFRSGATFSVINNNIVTTIPIALPVSPIENTITYNADIYLKFKAPIVTKLTDYYIKGDNIGLAYNNVLKKAIIRLNNTNKKLFENNFIITSLLIPDMDEDGKVIKDSINRNRYLDRFYLRNTVLSQALNIFLDATSYYTEIRIPIAAEKENGIAWVYKWDALRTLKEGTYYFTCKYPFQIQPFINEDYATQTDMAYATLYASTMFKIEVKGTPKAYDNEAYELKGDKTQYCKYNILKTLSNHNSLQVPTDNRTFPHREMNIDLYVLDSDSTHVGLMYGDKEDYSFKWTKIGSNHPDQSNLILLDKETIQNGIIYSETNGVGIPLFFTKNYIAPFFIAKMRKVEKTDDVDRQVVYRYTETSADDDTIEPIKLYVDPSQEQLYADSEASVETGFNDLDNLVLTMGKTYKLLFEYSGKISNIAYTNEIFENTLPLTDNSPEKINFARLVTISAEDSSDNNNAYRSEYIYRGVNNTLYDKNDSEYLGTGGFKSLDGSWQSIGMNESITREDQVQLTEYYYGNPYSKTAAKNQLLDDYPNDRLNINELSYFPYIMEGTHEEGLIKTIWPCKYITGKLDVFRTAVLSKAFGNPEPINFNEISLLTDHSNFLYNKVTKGISTLLQQTCGIFSQLVDIEPNIIGTTYPVHYWRINPASYSLYGTTADIRTVQTVGSFNIERRGNFSNNLIKNQYFDDRKNWSIYKKSTEASITGIYVADINWNNGDGKDMYTFEIPQNETICLRYEAGNKKYKTKFEAAINVKPNLTTEFEISNLLTVNAVFFYNKDLNAASTKKTIALGSEQIGDSNWYNFSAETANDCEASSVIFEFKNVSSNPLTISIAKAIVRKSETYKQRTGFSNISNSLSDTEKLKVTIDEHSLIFFQDSKKNRTIGLQFDPIINARNATASNDTIVNIALSGQTRAADFIKKWSYGKKSESSRQHVLLQPWVQRLYWYQVDPSITEGEVKSKAVLYSYELVTNNITKIKEKKENRLTKSDLFKNVSLDYNSATSSLSFSGSIQNIEIYNLNLALDLGSTTESTASDFSVLYLDDERFTGLTNCFYPNRYLNNLSTPVAVTNVQLLNDTATNRSILYELEYLPIIYDEKDQHISLNIMLHNSYTLEDEKREEHKGSANYNSSSSSDETDITEP